MPDDQNDDQSDPGRLRQMMEEANARAAAAESQLAETRSREMFRDAGLDPAKPLHAAAMRGYDGDPDPEAVRTYVTSLGLTEPAPPPAPVASETDQAALIRIAEAARDGGAPTPTPDRRAQLQQELTAKVNTRNPSKAEVEHLARELSRAGGYPVVEDYQ